MHSITSSLCLDMIVSSHLDVICALAQASCLNVRAFVGRAAVSALAGICNVLQASTAISIRLISASTVVVFVEQGYCIKM